MKMRSRRRGIAGRDAPGGGNSTGGPSIPSEGSVFVVGAHGGAGTTTLKDALWAGARELSRREASEGTVADGGGGWSATPVIVVGRGTAAGVAAAVVTALELRAVGAAVVLAVVGDGTLPEPAAVRARLRAVRDQVLDVVRVPYVARWRFIDAPGEPPTAYVDAVSRIRSAVERSEAGARRGNRAGAVSGAGTSEQRTGRKSVRTAKGTA